MAQQKPITSHLLPNFVKSSTKSLPKKRKKKLIKHFVPPLYAQRIKQKLKLQIYCLST